MIREYLREGFEGYKDLRALRSEVAWNLKGSERPSLATRLLDNGLVEIGIAHVPRAEGGIATLELYVPSGKGMALEAIFGLLEKTRIIPSTSAQQ